METAMIDIHPRAWVRYTVPVIVGGAPDEDLMDIFGDDWLIVRTACRMAESDRA